MFLTVIETKCIEENEIHVSTEMFLQTNTFFFSYNIRDQD